MKTRTRIFLKSVGKMYGGALLVSAVLMGVYYLLGPVGLLLTIAGALTIFIIREEWKEAGRKAERTEAEAEAEDVLWSELLEDMEYRQSQREDPRTGLTPDGFDMDGRC